MKKVTTLAAAAIAAMTFASCSNNNNDAQPTPDAAGTYASITFEEAGLRAYPADVQTDAKGLDVESNVKSASFFTSQPHTQVTAMTEVNGFTPENGKEKQFKSAPFKYTGATGQLLETGLVVNYNGLNVNDFKADKTLDIEKLGELAKSESFVMSSKTTGNSKTITAGVKNDEDEIKNNGNLFDYTVERVVSKVQVSGKPTVEVTDNGVAIEGVAFENFRYAVAGGATKVYLFGDKAGSRALGTDGTYGAFESAVHVNTNSVFKNNTYTSLREGLQKVSDLSLATLYDDSSDAIKFAKYNSLPLVADGSYNSASNANGIFFLENSVAAPGDYADITYVKIYGTLKPTSNLYKLNTNGDGVEDTTDIPTNDFTQDLKVSKVWAKNNGFLEDNGTIKTDKQGILNTIADDTENFMLTVTVKAGSIFYNQSLHKFYTSPLAARVDWKELGYEGNPVTTLFLAGKMNWKTPANFQEVGTTKHYDTRRNNIYSLQVGKILALGDSYDSIDPTDPNNPKPNPEDNPDEGEHNDGNPLENTYIQVKATILQWNLVHRPVDLGN
ncbi:MAG: Mfa1 family fimbria major subunit [Porphyromonas sp.]|nr:Mfa1 family fimbria major subunit [Porphyromonas sp.]